MSKNIPVLLEFNPEKVVGYIQIHDEEFLELLIKRSLDFNLGWVIDYKKEEIAAISWVSIEQKERGLRAKIATIDE